MRIIIGFAIAVQGMTLTALSLTTPMLSDLGPTPASLCILGTLLYTFIGAQLLGTTNTVR
jgi:hypothetical protein